MSTSKLPISVVISATDNVTVKVMEINQKLAKLTQPLNKLKDSFGLLGKEIGLDKLGSSLTNVGSKAGAFFGSMKSAAVGVAATLATLGIAFRSLVKGAADSADAIGDASKRLGVSTKFFQEFQYAAGQSGIEMDKVESILTKFSKNIGDASVGTGEAVGIFRGFGVSLKDASGKTRGMAEILPELADKFKKIKDPALRNAVAMRLFGKEGVKMAEILEGGSERISKFAAEAEKMGFIIGDDQIEKAGDFNDSWDKLVLSITRARDAFGAELFPVMIELFGKLSSLIAENRPQIIEFARTFAAELPGILTQVKDLFVALYGAAQTLAGWFNFLGGIFGRTNLVLGIMGVIIGGKVLASFIALTGSLIQLGGIALPMILKGAMLLIPAFAKLSVLLLANPIGLIVAGGAALVAIGAVLYNKWAPFRNLIDGIWEKVRSVGSFVGGKLGFGDSAGAASPSGEALGGAGTVAAANSSIRSSTENQISINFENMPKGTRVTQDKAEAPIDLALGYSMAGGL